MLKSLLFLSLLSIPLTVIVTIFLVWPSTANFSEGQVETHSIKITSPANGQNISIGTNLTISGIVTGNNSISTGNNNDGKRCYVSVLINNVKPYQNATADGPEGVNDYSKWYYTLSTKYAAINEGQNKLTGKLACLQETSSNTNSTTNNLIKWYSVNVTGVSRSTLTSTSPMVKVNNQTITNSTMNNPQQEQQHYQQSKMQLNTTANTNCTTTALHSNRTNNPTSPSTATQNNSKEADTSGGNVTTKLTQSPSNYNYNINNGKPLSVSIQSSRNIVNGKGVSIITGTAYDGATGKKIENAIVKLKITFTSNGTSKEIVGHKGEISYTVEIKPNSKNSFRTTVQASAPGYISTSMTSAYSSSSSSSSSNSTSNVTSNGNLQESIINNSGP